MASVCGLGLLGLLQMTCASEHGACRAGAYQEKPQTHFGCTWCTAKRVERSILDFYTELNVDHFEKASKQGCKASASLYRSDECSATLNSVNWL